ncbi:MAG: hypothetical protein JW794_10440 [Candidatus Cloacimonetes bacterium]|nr:hypothetical protein [Candidatus Cloacimonadota bacterium]
MKKDDFLHDRLFQILFLALLTHRKVKPLSRWEKPLSSQENDVLKKFDLKTESVARYCENGDRIREFIFSRNSNRIHAYLRTFDNTSLRLSPAHRKIEGFLFGYPSCCVENFIHNGYTPNKYIDKEQKLLFHWICPDCRISPSLFPVYRSIFDECQELYKTLSGDANQQIIRSFIRKALPYAAAAFFSLGFLSTLHADNHWIPVPEDDDFDYMKNCEELITGIFPSGESNTIAQHYKTLIDGLPIGVTPNSLYVIEHPTYGYYNCPICGEAYNMGHVTVHNPMHDLQIEIPYMALHFMDHGSFSYIIEDDTTRIDIALLSKILAPLDILHHALATPNDYDNDGLNDTAEAYFDMDFDNPYTHDIGIDDGHQIAQALIERISSLPVVSSGSNPPSDSIYIEPQLVWGQEDCIICGRTQNMGMAVIHNPLQGTSMTIPFIALHYMSHGRFVYDGTTNQGEIEPIELCVLLDLDLTAINDLPEIAAKFGYTVVNFPNPFDTKIISSTLISIEFSRKNSHHIIIPDNIGIYSIKGEFIKNIETHEPTDYGFTVYWDGTNSTGTNMPSGIYILKANINQTDEVFKKILLIR